MRPDVAAELDVLSTDEGLAVLAEARAVERPLPAMLERWRRAIGTERAQAAVRLAAARRRASGKILESDRLWLEPEGVEQATTALVAAHKAQRFAGAGVVVDLCCGLGGDSLALATVVDRGVMGVDLDPGMPIRLRWNSDRLGVGGRVLAVRADARRWECPPGALLHVDPDRRAHSSRKARWLSDYVPGLERLRELACDAPGGAIKLSAASDFERRFEGLDHEIEVVSLGGECKEATIWFGKLAGAARRRATSLPSGQTWTDRDGRGGLVPAVDEPGGWVFDPDPALVRAGLVDSYAQAMELTRLGPQINLLTGEVPRPDGLVRGYRVQDVVAFDEKRLRRLLAERRIGRLDIKPRGVDITPEQLRPRLRLEGPNSATLILAGGASRVRAILAVRDQEPDQIASSQPLSRRGS